MPVGDIYLLNAGDHDTIMSVVDANLTPFVLTPTTKPTLTHTSNWQMTHKYTNIMFFQ